MTENRSKRGRFIVFEGIDGAGKTTQIEKLRASLEMEGRRVVTTAEPTSSQTGRMLRTALSGKEARTACEMAALFTLDRIFHNVDAEAGVERALRDGADVLCDRYYYSSMAYQGSETDLDWVMDMNLNCPEIRKPDACIFLDLTPEESLSRIRAGRESTEIYETREKLTEVREKFFGIFKALADREKIFIVSAAGSIDEVAERIKECVDSIEEDV